MEVKKRIWNRGNNQNRLFTILFAAILLLSLVPLVSAVGSQTWYLSSTDNGLNKVMYKESQSGGAEPVLVERYATDVIWIANEPASVDVDFPAGDWTGHLRKTGDGTDFEVVIWVWDGNDFYFEGQYDGDFGASNDVDFTISGGSFTVFEGEWLAFHVKNWNKGDDFHIVTAGGPSYVSSPATDPGYPVPELPTIMLFSIGMIVLAGYVVLRRKEG